MHVLVGDNVGIKYSQEFILSWWKNIHCRALLWSVGIWDLSPRLPMQEGLMVGQLSSVLVH